MKKPSSSPSWSSWLIPVGLVVLFLLTHLYRLTALPVFADESIYIRWTQLIIDDWQQYLFFPMNDGKTPLHMWLMLPWQFVFSDQLYAGRFVSVLIGLGQLAASYFTVRALGGRAKTGWLMMAFITILPFWFFHHRMALTDSLLTLCLSLTFLFSLKTAQEKKLYGGLTWIALIGLSFGAALYSKVPAVLAAPAFALLALWPAELSWKERAIILTKIGLGLAGGVALFALLWLTPVFGQLFSRGSDFLFPWQEVLFDGKWRETVINIPTYLQYFVQYLSWPVMLLAVVGLFLGRHQRSHHVLFWSGLLFIAPIALLGKQVYPRYLFPASFFFTTGAVLALEELMDRWVNRPKTLMVKIISSLMLTLLASAVVTTSIAFMLPAWLQPDAIPFHPADRVQYLTEWSSGHGIEQAVEYIENTAKTKTIAVATEGSFGTLPDGVLLQLHRHDLKNIYVEGIGQPVNSVPLFFRQRAATSEQIILLVNSHRMNLKLAPDKLIAEYCRPYQAPCFQIWDITEYVRSQPLSESE